MERQAEKQQKNRVYKQSGKRDVVRETLLERSRKDRKATPVATASTRVFFIEASDRNLQSADLQM